ncbi:MAG: AbrB/MazE/SpoVT family DNA-binding domain-containing protein [Bryobacterales bacterium]|nr:AbrB/MazE/SpoVT family DNA-binding domain-containing protein [Bryobacterales bacterium]
MRTIQVVRWGNSLGLRLPKAGAAEARIGEGDTVEVSVMEVQPSCVRRRRLTPSTNL